MTRQRTIQSIKGLLRDFRRSGNRKGVAAAESALKWHRRFLADAKKADAICIRVSKQMLAHKAMSAALGTLGVGGPGDPKGIIAKAGKLYATSAKLMAELDKLTADEKESLVRFETSVKQMERARGVGALVGRFRRKVDKAGRLRIPQEWMAILFMPEFIFVAKDPHEKCVALIPEGELDSSVRSAVKLRVEHNGEIALPVRFCKYAGIDGWVELLGSVRMIKLRGKEKLRRASAVEGIGDDDFVSEFLKELKKRAKKRR